MSGQAQKAASPPARRAPAALAWSDRRALWPLAAVFLLRVLRNVVFVRGVEVGVVETVLGCLVVLLPYCLISFPFGCL